MAFASLPFAFTRTSGTWNLRISQPIVRVRLIRGETLRLPRWCESLYVVSGYAWLSRNAEDILLERGETYSIPPGKGGAVVVSVLREEELSVIIQ
jgi:Uncharacterized conserved protein, contains double-stranded beta-helix domain